MPSGVARAPRARIAASGSARLDGRGGVGRGPARARPRSTSQVARDQPSLAAEAGDLGDRVVVLEGVDVDAGEGGAHEFPQALGERHGCPPVGGGGGRGGGRSGASGGVRRGPGRRARAAGSICGREDRIRKTSQSSGLPGSSSSRSRTWRSSQPSAASRRSATRRRARETSAGRPARRGAVRLQERADDGPEGAVERVGLLGGRAAGVGVDLVAQLVADRPGDAAR